LKRAADKDPKLAAEIAKKWSQDQQKFAAAVKEKTEGRTQQDWAYPSCKKCYGRGHEGILIKTKTPVTCSCVTKTYTTWLKAFREEYNMQREKYDVSEISANETAPKTDSAENHQEALSDSPG
jgi:hypothetical protein